MWNSRVPDRPVEVCVHTKATPTSINKELLVGAGEHTAVVIEHSNGSLLICPWVCFLIEVEYDKPEDVEAARGAALRESERDFAQLYDRSA